jgi:hypothetical protein
MMRDSVHPSANQAAIERLVRAAIFEAREVYDDADWKFWAERWIDGRDRSFASARIAHDSAREAHRREVDECSEEKASSEIWGTSMDSPAESAAWAAGLALATAPIAPDLKAGLLRVTEGAWAWISVALGFRSLRPPRVVRTRPAMDFARRIASLFRRTELVQSAP